MAKQILFPDYFKENESFHSLLIDGKRFVNYTHNLDTIKGIHLTIEQSFMVCLLEGKIEFVGPDGICEVGEGESVLVPK